MDFRNLKKLNIGGIDLVELFINGVRVFKAGVKNLLPEATTTDRKTIFGGDYNGDGTPDGYITDKRLSSSGSESTSTGMCCSGFISAKSGDILRIKNIAPKTSTASYVISYNSSNTKVAHITLASDNDKWYPSTYYTFEDGLFTISLTTANFGTGFNAIRFSAGTISADTIVTINEEIA